MKAGADPEPRIVPFRGAYLKLRPERASLVRAAIYPVPDPDLPFLGAHFTRTIGGEVLLGPSALMAGARDAYRVGQAQTGRRARDARLGRDVAHGGPALALRPGGTAGRGELQGVRRKPPPLRPRARRRRRGLRALPGSAPRRSARDGKLVDDFVVSRTDRALHVRNAPSPAATSSLALARLIADRAETELGIP